MVTKTIRAPEAFFHRLYESDAVADAGYRVQAAFDAPGMPKGTGWVSFRVECPRTFWRDSDLWRELDRLAKS